MGKNEVLKKCVECKKLISKSATTCPKCGSIRPHPLPRLTRLIYLIVVVAVIGLLIYAVFGLLIPNLAIILHSLFG